MKCACSEEDFHSWLLQTNTFLLISSLQVYTSQDMSSILTSPHHHHHHHHHGNAWLWRHRVKSVPAVPVEADAPLRATPLENPCSCLGLWGQHRSSSICSAAAGIGMTSSDRGANARGLSSARHRTSVTDWQRAHRNTAWLWWDAFTLIVDRGCQICEINYHMPKMCRLQS